MSTARRFVLVLVLVLVGARGAGAQVVRGRVVEEGRSVAVSAAFLRLLDAAGTQRGAVLTDTGGRFLLRAPSPGRYKLTAERIGQHTTVSPVFELAAGQVLEYVLTVPTDYVRLEGLVAAGKGRCSLSRDAGAATFALWEEVRKALSIVTWNLLDDLAPYQIEHYTVTRTLPALDIIDQQREVLTTVNASPFRSASAVDLAQNGYVRQTADGSYDYFALDAQTLLSDAFLDKHCFRVRQPDRQHAGMIGLAFEPISSGGPPDITGVLWLNAATAELQYLEFTFTRHLMAVRSSREVFGGRVSFRRMRSGAWIVRDWWLRMPASVLTGNERPNAQGVRRGGVLAVREVGGRLLFASDARPALEPGPAAIEGMVFDSTRSKPLAGAHVWLLGSRRIGTADRDGRFRIAGLPAGSYELAFFHPRADTLALPVMPRTVTVPREGTVSMPLAIPAAAACVTDSAHAGMVGFVTHGTTGEPVEGATVLAQWRTPGVRQEGAISTSSTGSNGLPGRFLLCGLPIGAAVRLTITGGGRTTLTQTRLETPGLHHQDLIVR